MNSPTNYNELVSRNIVRNAWSDFILSVFYKSIDFTKNPTIEKDVLSCITTTVVKNCFHEKYIYIFFSHVIISTDK